MQAIIDGSAPYMLSLGALICFVLIVCLAWRDKIKAATLLSVLFFLCVLLAYFPRLDSIRAFGINATLRQTIDRAKEILAQLKQVAIMNAKGTYMNLANSGRWGTGPTFKDKQAMFDRINDQLTDLKVNEAERIEIGKPIVEFIGADLYNIYVMVFDRLLTWKHQEAARRKNAADNTPEAQKALQVSSDDIADWRRLAGHSPYQELKTYDLSAYLRAAMPTNLLDDKERATAQRFMNEVQSLYDGCRLKGGYTSEAAQFLDNYDSNSGADLKVRELFGINVSSVQ